MVNGVKTQMGTWERPFLDISAKHQDYKWAPGRGWQKLRSEQTSALPPWRPGMGGA